MKKETIYHLNYGGWIVAIARAARYDHFPYQRDVASLLVLVAVAVAKLLSEWSLS
jgi:hypothetical protein